MVSTIRSSVRDVVVNNLKWWLASLVHRFCGCEILYWVAPRAWEAYMSEGEPMPQVTPIPENIFRDIDTIINNAPESTEADRVTEWLYSNSVMVDDNA